MASCSSGIISLNLPTSGVYGVSSEGSWWYTGGLAYLSLVILWWSVAAYVSMQGADPKLRACWVTSAMLIICASAAMLGSQLSICSAGYRSCEGTERKSYLEMSATQVAAR
jgi:hypothetical protein